MQEKKEGIGMVRVIIFVIMIACYCSGTPEWLGKRCLQSALAYPFHHANVFHLCVNLIMAYGIFRPRKNNFLQVLQGFAISVIVYPVSSIPLIGMSNMLFAILGLRTPSFSSAWWRQTPVRVFMAAMLLMLPFRNIGGATHIISFALGTCMSYMGRIIREELKDVSRYL